MKVGDTVNNHLLERQIGSPSAYGEIFQVRNILDNSISALKVAKDTGKQSDLDRFSEENRIMHRLQPSTHIIAPHCNVTTYPPEFHYYLMELADMDLMNYIHQNQNLDFAQLIALFKEICQGLKHAHSHNIAHRDLHVGNILLKNANSKLTDFGKSKDFSSKESFTSGKPCWGWLVMPPEVHFDIWQNPSLTNLIVSDVYALGIILFSLFETIPIVQATNLTSDISNFLNPYSEEEKLSHRQKKALYVEWLKTQWAKNNGYLSVQLNGNDQTVIINTLLHKLTNLDYAKRFQSVTLIEENMQQLGL